MSNQFRWHIYSAICVPKITGIGHLLLKLSLVVGWYPFLRHSVVYGSPARTGKPIQDILFIDLTVLQIRCKKGPCIMDVSTYVGGLSGLI